MKKIPFIWTVSCCILLSITICTIGGSLDPTNTPAPTMRTLDELYRNIQPGLPSDWKAYPHELQNSGACAIHLTIGGTFPIPGSCAAPGKENTILVVGLGHEIDRNYDEVTGAVTGLPEHKTFIISKYVDKSSPLLQEALDEIQSMHLTLNSYRIKSDGSEELYFKTELTEARVVNIRTAFPNIEQISFTYNAIRWIYLDGNIQYESIRGGSN